ncbi:MAG: hypothetical protein KF887_19085 [Paracoccaceae bacterium]|nr:MAG: hypothetical protein KF887_19085 [Paracoccaceae bacterium]
MKDQSRTATAEELRHAAGEKIAAAAMATRAAAGAAVSEAQDKAVEALHVVGDAAVKRADGAKVALSDAGDRLASGLRNAASDAAPDSLQARSLNTLAGGISDVAGGIARQDVSTLLTDARAFARRHPGACAVGAALAGFALVRLLRAEPTRRLPQTSA